LQSWDGFIERIIIFEKEYYRLSGGMRLAPNSNQERMMVMQKESQTLPVRLYQSEERLMMAVPMPGLEAGDISVNISGDRVTIRGEERGPGQHQRDLILEEWTIGPYYCEVSLPQAVDGTLANATYGNGVLVLSMPKAKTGQAQTDANFQLEPIESTRGERVGHSGQDIHRKTTAEHAKKHR
jgi:HSP20 family protein